MPLRGFQILGDIQGLVKEPRALAGTRPAKRTGPQWQGSPGLTAPLPTRFEAESDLPICTRAKEERKGSAPSPHSLAPE